MMENKSNNITLIIILGIIYISIIITLCILFPNLIFLWITINILLVDIIIDKFIKIK